MMESVAFADIYRSTEKHTHRESVIKVIVIDDDHDTTLI